MAECDVKRVSWSRWLLVTTAMIALTGCVSHGGKTASVDGEDLDASDLLATSTTPEHPTPSKSLRPQRGVPNTQGSNPSDPYVDPAVAASPGTLDANQETAQPGNVLAGSATTRPASLAGLAMQPTGIHASRSSIYALPDAPVQSGNTSTGDVPAFVQPVPQTTSTPATGALDDATAPVNGKAHGDVSQNTAPANKTDGKKSEIAALPNQETGMAYPMTAEAWSIAGLMAAKRKNKEKPDPNRVEPSPAVRSAQLAYMGIDDLPGGKVGGLYTLSDTVDRDDEEPVGLMKLASLSGLTRIAPNGLTLQTKDVNVGCFKPELVQMIKSVERHFRHKAVVTSGYRDVRHNKAVGGVEGSLHMSCDAADIQVVGVSKWELAGYLRAQSNRGGVGTYCHTASVHLDTGTPRDWNWSCRRNPATDPNKI